jgi:hypothetical protein
MKLARVAGDPSAAWKVENAAAASSDMVLESVQRAHTHRACQDERRAGRGLLHAIGRASRPTSWRQWVYAVAVVLVPVAGFAVAGGVGGQLRVDPDSGPVQVSR